MKLVYGGYGHHPSGKQYVYWAGDNYKTGQNVVAPVTNWKTGKTYNTMFTIMRTSGENSPMAKGEVERLQDRGINIKTIGGRDVLSLPSGRDFSSAKQWKEWSNFEYTERKDRLINSFKAVDNTGVRTRLLGL